MPMRPFPRSCVRTRSRRCCCRRGTIHHRWGCGTTPSCSSCRQMDGRAAQRVGAHRSLIPRHLAPVPQVRRQTATASRGQANAGRAHRKRGERLLHHAEQERHSSIGTRNCRLAALRPALKTPFPSATPGMPPRTGPIVSAGERRQAPGATGCKAVRALTCLRFGANGGTRSNSWEAHHVTTVMNYGDLDALHGVKYVERRLRWFCM